MLCQVEWNEKVDYGKMSIEDLHDEVVNKPVKFGTSRFEDIVLCNQPCECENEGRK
jgi:hypothetical protein